MRKEIIYIVTPLMALLFQSCQIEKKAKSGDQNNAASSKEQLVFNTTEWDSSGIFSLSIPRTGRYQIILEGLNQLEDTAWIEDHIENKDDRQYNISGNILFSKEKLGKIDGAPLRKGEHLLRIHNQHLDSIKSIEFKLLQTINQNDCTLVQKMNGENWHLVWQDEFEKDGLVDSNKWTYNIGNWGWGNNELQYYTLKNLRNARQEDGNLIIEAHRQKESTNKWTSARLTTQGKFSFLQGRVEFRAKVPLGRGTWAAGWLLGSNYADELSWPYCGEIDVLECVGYEIDSLGNGKNHASCHTPAFYFKKNNHITGEIELDSMNTKFHNYAIEWYENRIEAYLDNEHYYTYDKTANELEWPFEQAQSIIINLAVGGGWGGIKGVDPTMDSQQYILDYIRVYEKR